MKGIVFIIIYQWVNLVCPRDFGRPWTIGRQQSILQFLPDYDECRYRTCG